MPDYLTHPTSTLMLRAERLLQTGSIQTRVQPRPPGLSGRCSLALRLPEGTLAKALELLAAAKLPVPHQHRLPE